MFSKIILFLKVFKVIFHQITNRISLKLTSLTHCLTYHPTPHPRNIVIIGASFAGYTAAHRLTHSIPTGYRVIVIEKNTHFQLSWVLPRFCTVAGHESKAFIPYGPYLSDAPEGSYTWITDTVEKIVPSQENDTGAGVVMLGSGECVEYEYLVLATGSSGGLPSRVGDVSKDGGMRVIQAEQERIQSGHDVVVVGGGPAGVELAMDVKSKYPGKNVTLVHSRKALLNEHFGQKLRDTVLHTMETIGVTVILGERIITSPDVKDVTLSSGKTISCDCLIKCIGQKPNSDILSLICPLSISQSGHIKVRPTLQLADTEYTHIYAAGDVLDMGNINGRAAVEQAQIVAGNIVRAIKGRTQQGYSPQWWEGLTKLTLGLERNIVSINDGQAEVNLSMKSKRVELDSAVVWKYLGAKPFVDCD